MPIAIYYLPANDWLMIDMMHVPVACLLLCPCIDLCLCAWCDGCVVLRGVVYLLRWHCMAVWFASVCRPA